MKYVKNYNGFFNVNENIKFNRYENIKETKMKINSLLKTVFSIFQTSEDIEEIFEGSDLLNISIQIYDYFTDIKDIVELKERDLKVYAKNLDLLQESNLVNAIINKTYEDKYNTKLEDDLDKCIKYLKDKSDKSSKIYIDNLIKMKNFTKSL